MRIPCLIVFVGTLVLWSGGQDVSALDEERSLSQCSVHLWTREQGLPLDALTALAQTADGYLWVGTQRGLARFDGSEFTIFDTSNTPEMTSDWIDRLLADRRGELWIATQKEILRFDRGSFAQVEVEAPGGERVEVLYQDALDGVWAGFDDPGLLRRFRDGRFAIVRDAAGVPVANVDWIGEREAGEVCFVENGDVVCLAGDTRVPLGVAARIGAPVENARVAIFPDGTIRVCPLNGGMYVVDGESVRHLGEEQGVPTDYVNDIRIDRSGATWLTRFGGVTRIRGESVESLGKDDGLPPGFLSDWVEDHEGNVWLATQAGLARLSDSRFAVYSVEEGLAARQAHVVFVDHDGGLWVSSAGAGLQRFDGESWTAFGEAEGVTNDVLSIWQEPDGGAIWIGTGGGGAGRMEEGVFVRHDAPAVVFAGYAEADGTQWFGSLAGLVRTRGDEYEDGVAAVGKRVLTLQMARDGALWMGTFEGEVLRYDGERTTRYGVDEGLGSDPVPGLYESRDGTIWAASVGGGLLRFDDAGVQRITRRQGLPSEQWYAVVEDLDGALWLTSPDGIVVVERRSLDDLRDGTVDRVELRRFGKKDGMRSAECNGGYSPAAARDAAGRLWFPTTDGVVRIAPDESLGERAPPRVLIEGLTADGDAVSLAAAGAGLPTGKRNLGIDYTGISFLAPDEVRFRYRLARYDSEWTDAGSSRNARFTRVPPGRYTFEVQAASGDGAWSEASALTIRVPPHFHETWVFYALVVALAGLSLYAWHRYRLHQSLALERVRLRIARDLHDDLGASLSSISFQSEAAKRAMGSDTDRSKKLIDQVGESAREAVDGITDIVWAIDPRQDDLASLAARLRGVAGEWLDSAGIDWRVETPDGAESIRLTPELRRQLYLILKEAVSNVARHAGASTVSVRLERSGGTISAVVVDDGCGFDPDGAPDSERRGGNGVPNMCARAAALGGSVKIDSAAGRGTTLTVRIRT